MNAFEYVAAGSLEEALAVLAEQGEDARPIAGGTALVNFLKQGLVAPAVLVGLRRLAADPLLGAIRIGEDGRLWLGALTTHEAVARHPLVQQGWPLLAAAFRRVATPRIRNAATVGGCLAHADPAQDPPAALLAYSGWVELASAAGRRSVPVDEFYRDYYETALEPGELVVGVRIEPAPTALGWSYQKLLPRTADDYATVGASALALGDRDGRLAELRIALIAAGPTPRRFTLAGGELAPIDQLASLVAERARLLSDPLDDWRGSRAYKQRMAGVVAWRAAREALAGLAAQGGSG